jgi:hypothetical protein
MVSVDPCATGQFVPLPEPLEIAIVPDEPVVWKAVLPSLRRPGEDFHFGLKAEDAWGNPTPKARGRLRLVANLPVAESNPMVVKGGDRAGFWGDLIGQSGESIGVGAAKEYFQFARDLAFLDVTSHQANDFQVNNAFWGYLKLFKKSQISKNEGSHDG